VAATRRKTTKPSLTLAKYIGNYQNETFGNIKIVKRNKKLTLKTKLIDFEMSHWHLDSYLVWDMKDFVAIDIGTDGSVLSFKLFGEVFVKEKGKRDLK